MNGEVIPSVSYQTEVSGNAQSHAKPENTTKRLHYMDRSSVSLVMKYLIFIFNILVWLIGCILIAVGIWATSQKNVNVIGSAFINPVLLLLISGSVIFLIGFLGCIGALRENTWFLWAYVICVGIIFLLLVAAAIILFAFRGWVKEQLVKSPLEKTIAQYRDDLDLQDLIDWVQSDWLKCCGIANYDDWEQNLYFNCSSPGVEACGVPFSCCVPDPTQAIQNLQCGYGVRKDRENIQFSNTIYTKGCIEKGDEWFQHYMIPVAGVIVAAAVILIFAICLSCNLISDINRQKSKWKRSAS